MNKQSIFDLFNCGKETLAVAGESIGLADIPGTKRVGPVVQIIGSGLSDLTISGTYTGDKERTYRILIDGTGTPDTIKWSDDGGTTWQNVLVNITGSAQTLNHGLSFTFAATTGHTLANAWDFTAYPDSKTAVAARISVETAQIRYFKNGSTPTSSIGTIADIGEVIEIDGIDNLYHFRAIRTGSTSANLNIQYF